MFSYLKEQQHKFFFFFQLYFKVQHSGNRIEIINRNRETESGKCNQIKALMHEINDKLLLTITSKSTESIIDKSQYLIQYGNNR